MQVKEPHMLLFVMALIKKDIIILILVGVGTPMDGM